MAEENKKLHSRIRTFANDLKTQREKSGLPNKSVVADTKGADSSIPKEKEDVVLAPRVEHEHIQESKVIDVEIDEVEPDTIPAEDTPEVSTKIPAFHELDKNLTSPKVPIPPPKKINEPNATTESKKPSKVNIGYDSKVITDTKSNRFKLFPAIIVAIKSWFNVLKTNRKKKLAPKYSIAETNHRKGVIQKATSKSGAIFTADNETIKEQIRRRRQQEKEQEEKISHEPETTWSPNTETGYNLLEAPDVTTKVVIEYKKPRASITPVIESAVTPNEVVDKETGPEVADLIESAQSIKEHTESQGVTTDHKQKDKIGTDHQPSRLLNIDTNILTIATLIIIVSFVTILFATRIISQQSSPIDIEEKTVTFPEKSIIKNTEVVSVALTNDYLERIPQFITSTIENMPMGLVEIPITSLSGGELTPSYLFGLLRFQTLPSFRQSITSARFATINHSSPVMVMRFVDEDTVKGGLLNWEKTMPSDMRVLYNIPMEAEGKFTDEKIGDTDVRLLRYNNEILIIYGIINGNTILITSKVSDFAQIVELGFSD